MAQGLLGGVLPAIYSGADQLKRGVYGLLTNPMQSIENTASGLIGSRLQRQDLMNQAFSNPDRPFQVTNQNALGQLGENVLTGELGIAPVGMFIGQGSKAWKPEQAFKAAKLEKQGKSPQEIWSETGTARFADGQWRQEISDADAKMIAKPTKEALSKNPNMQDVMSHPELYQSYDEMLSTKLKPQEGYAGGSYESATGNIGLKPLSVLADWRMSAFKDPKIKTLLHESQHKIQGIEDWARGGGYNEFTQQADAEIAKKALMIRDEIDRLPNSIPFNERANTVKELFEKLDQTPIDDTVMQVVKDYKDNPTEQLAKIVDVYGLNQRSTAYSPEEMYSRLAGEAESRLTERRFKLSPDERMTNYPYSYGTDYGLDIPMDRLLVRTDAGYVNTPLKDLIEQGLLGK
jgi:hypothetical protein